LWFNLSDPAVEEALYDSVAMRSFAGIDLGSEGAPDETTIFKFRDLLERNKLGKTLPKAVNPYLHENGIKIADGTIVDATIISAPSSTKNKDGERDPEMHQTAKSRQSYFGMKAHLGVDSKSKLTHTILASAANVGDALALPYLLHGNDTRVWGDQRYQGQSEVIHRVAPRALDCTNRRYRFGTRVDQAIKTRNRNKSRVRARVEHPIGVIKRIFGFTKVRYRGLAKNLKARSHGRTGQPLQPPADGLAFLSNQVLQILRPWRISTSASRMLWTANFSDRNREATESVKCRRSCWLD
jgi:IS5 family transposase